MSAESLYERNIFFEMLVSLDQGFQLIGIISNGSFRNRAEFYGINTDSHFIYNRNDRFSKFQVRIDQSDIETSLCF